MIGNLYLCATPIGNLEDITYRVVRILSEVDFIAAEDTRHTLKLLNHFEIKNKLISYHEHNKDTKGKEIVKLLLEGKNIALVTDAGTPAISDPGEDLVKLCYENNIKVTSLPGASAVVTALTISGLSTRRFTFEGFFSKNKREIKDDFERIKEETRTIVMYETPHRLKEMLKLLLKNIGNRKISIIREITKKYEEVNLTTIEKAIEYYNEVDPRGEYVLIIEGKDIKEIKSENIQKWLEMSLEDHMSFYMNEEGLSKKDAMKRVAKDRNMSKSEVYKMLL